MILWRFKVELRIIEPVVNSLLPERHNLMSKYLMRACFKSYPESYADTAVRSHFL